ncbi:EF-hand domain-containing protein [Pelagicoccus mobilis]|uniref:EF-hand domain-containing protein n=1 Tax=Pelagicoccus mobilis TaxID=415221 RepID=A0A934VSH4_9BACT|nr:EF-hand domain-containing protein [Pelagicoccus mobilis]MBK1879020.1 EF-hand domain-containing protein [Pelagicoccus mobilis]
MKKITRYLLAALLVLSTASLGFSASKRQQAMFKNGDADGDGFLSQEEFVAVKVKRGKSTAKEKGKEFDAKQRAKGFAKGFSKIDKDGDGKLSEDEFYASFQKKK